MFCMLCILCGNWVCILSTLVRVWTHCRFSKHPQFFLLVVVLDLSSSKALTLQPQDLHSRTDLLKYVICKPIDAYILSVL